MRKFLFAGGVCEEIKTANLEGKVVIVTGASPGGLGSATASLFLRLNATVIVTATTEQRAKVAADEVGCEGHALNLRDADSIHEFVGWFNDKYECLDILVNNAGIHLDLLAQWKKPKLSEEGIELQWHTNFLGTFLLTHLLLPKLEQAADAKGEARIVNVVSELHRIGNKNKLLSVLETKGAYESGYNSWRAYGQSKLALVLCTNELTRRETREGKKVFANSLHPGAVKTNVAGKGLSGNRVTLFVRDMLSCLESYLLKTPEEGAQTSLYCAISKELNGVGGKYFKDCKAKKPSSQALDIEFGEKLYDETLKALGLK